MFLHLLTLKYSQMNLEDCLLFLYDLKNRYLFVINNVYGNSLGGNSLDGKMLL